MKRATWGGRVLTGDQALELHHELIVEAIPELADAVDPARRDGLAFVIVAPEAQSMDIGFGPRDDVLHDLLVRADQWRSSGVRLAAAELHTTPDASEGSFKVLVVAAGLVSCIELPLSLLAAEE